jgi:hypothetical protein
MAIFGLQRNSSSSLAPPPPQPPRAKPPRYLLRCLTSTTTTSLHLSPCLTTNCCRCLSLASTSLSPLPHRHLGAFFILHHQYSAIGAELPSLLPLLATPPPNIITSSASLLVRSLILAHRCLIPCSALPLKTCRSLLNMKECRSDFTPVRKLATFS